MTRKPFHEELEQKIRVPEEDSPAGRQPRCRPESVLEELRNDRDFLKLLLDHAHAFIVAIGVDGATILMNKALLGALGYSAGEVTGRDYITTFVPEEDRETLRGIFKNIEESGSITRNENRIQGKSGQIYLVEWHGQPVFYQREGRKFFVGIGIDITARREAETQREAALEELLMSEQRYRNILDSVQEAYYEVDLQGNYTFFNNSTVIGLGYDADEMHGLNFRRYVDTENAEEIKQAYHRLFLTGNPVKALEFELISRNGTRIMAEASASLIRNEAGMPIGFRGVVRDVGERKRAEAEREAALGAFRESEKKYRLVVENANDIIWTFDLASMTFDYVSPSVERILGYPAATAIGMKLEDTHPPDALLRIRRDYENLVTGKIPGDRMVVEQEHYTADGRIVWMEVSARLLRDERGRAFGISGTTRDISERKQAEEYRLELERRLLCAQKMESIGTLAGGIAHDFNNLLMGIQGYVSLIMFDLDPQHPHYTRLKLVEEQIDSGANLTRQLLGFARGGRYEVKPTAMNTLLRKTTAMFGRTKKEITVQEKLAENLWTVEVDRAQMEQVFMNLYVNAWQAMPDGGNLTVATESTILDDRQVEAYGIDPGRYVKISVTDTGMGMDRHTLERIFDPFFSTKTMGRGTGLGLATVYGIVQGHRGMINAHSITGTGTTFSIYLPASDKAVETEAVEPAIDIIGGSETILLVDDEAMVLDVSRDLLESLGYKVYTARSGQEALNLVADKNGEVDLVVLDMIMPGISGGKTFDGLREINPAIKVLLCSGYGIDGEGRTIMDRGCNAFIQKPFHLNKLARTVRLLLD